MIVFEILNLLLTLYYLVLIARIVLDLVQMFARSWRPTGVVLVIANVVYGLTDPPLRFLRRFIPPLRLGGVALDLAILVLFVGIYLARILLAYIAFAVL